MADYKADTTLNERDTLFDLLITEKTLVKLYAFATTEAVSKGFRTALKTLYSQSVADQMNVFMNITETDYARVCSANESDLKTAKDKFLKIQKEL